MEILEPKSTITKVRNLLEELELGREISELEDRSIKIIKFEKQEKRMKSGASEKCEPPLSPPPCKTGIQEGREKGQKKYFKN